MRSIFTSESVTEGHPDKVSDRISDAILDAMLAGDPTSRVACETLTSTGVAVVAGEITSATEVDIEAVVRGAIRDIGYTSDKMGYDAATCDVQVRLDPQSPDISQGVTAGAGLHRDQGAGDQGMMFGYACRETDTLMPAPIYWAHRLTERLTEVRKRGIVDDFYPDGKSQITLAYEDGQPVHADTVVIAQQHADDVEHAKIVEDVREHVIGAVLPPELIDPLPEMHINATGRFVIGGPHGDCGLTGRKIIVDTYGGYAPHGGGAFSGKDPSKVDRSAAYAARWVAKNVVAAGMADRCQVALAYSIGVADPLWVDVKTFGTGNEGQIHKAIGSEFDLRPRAIIEDLDLLRPIYTPTAAYGHFGRELPNFTWEKPDVL
jgi:S-adenosylmethionine synthetase